MSDTTEGPERHDTALSPLGSWAGHLRPHQREWTDAERAEVLEELFPPGRENTEYVWRFLNLMVLSTVIAALGLLSNSAAVVIGAMLVAPLMTPILGVAFSIVTGRPRRLLASLGMIGVGVVVAILAAAAVSALAPGTVTATDLTNELLARTEPSLLDLGVAIAAGLAAGYVLTHPQAGSSLPGVAIAVALVPPLATVGVAWQLGATDEARGALLLFATNLLAIIVSAMLVALASGIAPLHLRSKGRVRTGLIVTTVMLALVAVPLTWHTIDLIEDRTFTRKALAALADWDPNAQVREVTADVGADGHGNLAVIMATSTAPEPAWRLAELLQDRTGRAVRVEVDYVLEQSDAAVAE